MGGSQSPSSTLQGRPRRPVLAIAASTVHIVLGVACVGIAVYCLYLTRSPQILKDKDAAETVYGLKIGAAIVGPVAIPYLLVGIGVWKGRLWGWVLGAVLDASVVALLLSDTLSERRIDWDDVEIAVICLAPLLLLLFPPVWRWCRRSGLQSRATDVAG